MFDSLRIFENVTANDVAWIVIIFVIWAILDRTIVRALKARRVKKVEAASFKNRKPSVIY